jgi:hypothetical protein
MNSSLLVVTFAVFSCLTADANAAPVGPRPTKQVERAAALNAAAKSFRLDLAFRGEQDKPYYGLTLSVPVVPQLTIDPVHPVVQITEEEAVKLISHLAADGFLEQAKDELPAKPPAGPCYTLTVRASGKAGPVVYYEDLGWGAPMLKRLDGIRGALIGKAGEATNSLLARLAGHRKEWSKGQDR